MPEPYFLVKGDSVGKCYAKADFCGSRKMKNGIKIGKAYCRNGDRVSIERRYGTAF